MCFDPHRGAVKRAHGHQYKWAPGERHERALEGPETQKTQCNITIQSAPRGAEEEEASDALKNRLTAAENVLATLPVDLDGELRFAPGLLALTDRRLIARDAAGAWAEWPLAGPGLELQLADHAGIGTLDLLDSRGRLARWRCAWPTSRPPCGCEAVRPAGGRSRAGDSGGGRGRGRARRARASDPAVHLGAVAAGAPPAVPRAPCSSVFC